MNEQNAPRVYGVRVGLIAALFSIGQALLLYASAMGSYAAVHAVQQGINVVQAVQQPVVDFFLLLPGLIPMLVVAYGSMLVAGLITAWLAWYAGRLAAIRVGRRAGGASAGMWVWLISTLVWIAASVIVVAVTHMDGTVSGIFTGTGKPEFIGAEIAFLVGQEVVVALIGLGVCAFAGSRGAAGAPLVEPAPEPFPQGMAAYPFAVYPAPWGMTPPQGYQPGMTPGYPHGAPPPAGLPPYPGAVYPPQLAWAPPPGVYPPPPSHYLPQPAPQPQATQPQQQPTPAGDQTPAPDA
jgi:hypothetical protein